MRLIRSRLTTYLVAGPFRHKSLEVGGGKTGSKDEGFDWNLRLRTKGDHAGLQFFVELKGYLFEINLTDGRHWNWKENRFYRDGEEPPFEGYPHE